VTRISRATKPARFEPSSQIELHIVKEPAQSLHQPRMRVKRDVWGTYVAVMLPECPMVLFRLENPKSSRFDFCERPSFARSLSIDMRRPVKT
jgi:hypothetical protein